MRRLRLHALHPTLERSQQDHRQLNLFHRHTRLFRRLDKNGPHPSQAYSTASSRPSTTRSKRPGHFSQTNTTLRLSVNGVSRLWYV